MDINIPIQSDGNDSYEIHKKPQKFIYALNANIQNEDGNSSIIQNEHSNLLCSMFKPGYSVLHHQVDRVNDCVYFWLKNDATGCSEIGRICHQAEYTIEDIEKNCNCNAVEILNEPLEDTEQTPLCTYETIVTDCCGDVNSLCLNFDKKNRISSEIKVEDGRIYLYWVDGSNPDRRVNLLDPEQFRYEKDPCSTDEPIDRCLICDKLNIDKKHSKPCLKAKALQIGGNVKEGAYMFAVAYSDIGGAKITRYMSHTNWVKVKDSDKKIYQPSELDRNSGYSIRLEVNGLDLGFDYYKMFVVAKAEVDGKVGYFEVGVFPTTTTTVIFSGYDNLERLAIDEITSIPKIYNSSKFVKATNDFLLRGGMKAQIDVNLQPVMSLVGQFVKFRDVMANEDLYANGVFCSLYEAYMRDEVYPLSIRVWTNDGYVSPLSPLVARAPKLYSLGAAPPVLETSIIDPSDSNYKYIVANEYTQNCNEIPRNKLWQFYNTSSETIDFEEWKDENYCNNFYLQEESFEVTLNRKILKEMPVDVDGNVIPFPPKDVILKDGVSIKSGGDFVDLEQFWKENGAQIVALTLDDDMGFDILRINDPLSPYHIVPPTAGEQDLLFPDSCPSPITASSSKIVITNNGTIDPSGFLRTFKPKTGYTVPSYDGSCLNYKTETNPDLLKYECDADASELLIPQIQLSAPCCANSQPFNVANFYKSAGIVFKRNNNYKKTCVSAQTIPINNNDIDVWTSVAIPYDVKGAGALNSDYQNASFDSIAHTISATEYFTAKLHTNAVWLKIKNTEENNGLTFIASKFGGCPTPKDLLKYSDYVRIGVYDDCNGVVGNFVYGAIYNLNTGHIFQLDYKTSNPTPSIPMSLGSNNDTQYKLLEKKTYYITFDTPIINYSETYIVTPSLSDPCGVGGLISNPDLFGAYDCRNSATIVNAKVLSGTCGCFNFKALETDVIEEKFVLKDYSAAIEYSYSKLCYVKKYGEIKCDPILNKQYTPAYWESTRLYPCNSELWDSSGLKIKPSDISAEYRPEFITTFTLGGLGGTDINGDYILDPARTNFQNTPIRHFKAPDNKVSPHQDGEGKYFGAKNIIYPMGLWIDNDVINSMLDVAASNKLITQEFRNKIVGYEIFRGDRRMNKSILAKGIGFDPLTYKDADGRLWSTQNYPFNDLHEDVLHNGGSGNKIKPFNKNLGEYGNQLTFLSPDTFFNRPAISGATELKLEAFLAGETKGNFADVEDYPKMTILSSSAFGLANTLATTEMVLETLMKTLDITTQDSEVYRFDGGFVFSANPVGIGFHVARIATGIAELLITLPDRIGKAASEWVQIFYTNGTPQNYASMYVGEAKYENHISLDSLAGQTLRPIAHAHYLMGENYEVNGVGFQDIKINNSERDKVLYLNLGRYKNGVAPIEDIFLNYMNLAPDSTGAQFNYDDSRYSASDVNKCDGIISRGIPGRNTMSPYISIKNYVPDQYGDIDDVHWINTGYCGDLTKPNKCDVIFGGDIYISRYSHKRKFKFFDVDILGAPSLTAFNHSEYYNLVKPRFFVDYNKTRMDGLINPYPTIRSEYRFDCDTTDGFYIDGRSKFYLYYFGYVHFLVESEFNCNFRYGRNEKELNIYENCGDVVKWSQPKNVAFAADNFSGGYRADVFSIDRQIEDYTILSQKYNKKEWEAFGNYDDRVIRSEQDNQKKGLGDPYTVYKPLNYKDFGKQYGNFYGMESLSDMRAMFRFENGFVILNSNSTIEGTMENFELGQGDIFKNKATIAFQSDLGYGGTQHRAFVSTPFGSFWTDTKRGNIHFLPNGGNGHEEISSLDTFNWFKQNLPFQILKEFPNLPDSVLDNTRLGLGITMGYDARYQRVFVTKRDARVKFQYKNLITYNTEINEFIYNPGGEMPSSTIIYPNDLEYFDDYSWTRAYSPPAKSWLSFYSFKPDYYIDHYTYFQTGFMQGGLWSHLLTNKSYQVYYGTRYPFKLITALEEKYVNRLLQHYDYWLDVRRYHDEIDYASLPEKNMDYACVFNRDNNTGKLVLVNRLENNFFQDFEYPKFNTDNVEILSSWTENKWSINNLYDLIKNKNSNVPIWLNTKSQDDKDLNPSVFDYTKREHNYMKGDVFNFLLVQEKESRLKYIVRIILSNNKPYS